MLTPFKQVLFGFIAILWVCSFNSCSDSTDSTIIETQIIVEYIEGQSLEYTLSTSGLYYSIIDTGDTDRPILADTVVVDYEILLLPDELVQSTTSTGPITIELSYLIDGLSEGLRLIGRGGVVSLLIPSDLAFEDRSEGAIPPNSPVRIEISLNEFYADLYEYHSRLIEAVMTDQGLDTDQILDDVYYAIQDTGVAPFVTDSSIVTLYYQGYLLDGTTFDDQYMAPSSVTVDMTETIEGWQIAFPLFGVGGQGTIFIPSPLAFGSTGTIGVLADTPVAYDIEIISIE